MFGPSPSEKLIKAVKAGDFIEAAGLLMKGANPDTVLEDHGTVLMLAVERGDAKIAHLLIEHHAGVDFRGDQMWTPLMRASTLGHTDIAALLIEKGADVNMGDGNYYPALVYAVQNGHADVAGLLIDKGADINAMGRDGRTMLMHAAYYGHTEIAQRLTDEKVDVNAKNTDGDSALIFAVNNNKVETVRLLIERGADVNDKDRNGKGVLRLAMDHDNKEIAQMLIDNGADVRVLRTADDFIKAVDNGDLQTVKECLAVGVDVETPINNWPALHQAIYRDHPDVVKYLVSHGASIDSIDYNGRTPLQVAQYYSHEKCVAFLEIAERIYTKPEWSLFGSSGVAHVESSLVLERQLTEIFNFESRERRVLSENLKTGAETSEDASFDDLAPSVIKKALQQFKNLGGEADDDYVLTGKARSSRPKAVQAEKPAKVVRAPQM